MSKYDFDLDLESVNSLSVIIDMIKPDSKILEFGPAHGRLTKYLKYEMNCKVDIIELDEKAGIEASKYANKYFIGEEAGNIENYIWLDSLKNEKYDYIIFADVLEHLYSPEKVLKKCKQVLKINGSILLSIPNIAHNSIIIDLINDEFKYNDLGLLDNTHIRFFTYKSLNRMINNLGLISVNEKAIYSRVSDNEIINSYGDIKSDIAKELKNRDKGNIYQYIFEVKKSECYEVECVERYINFEKNYEYELVCYIKELDDIKYTEQKTVRKRIQPGIVKSKVNLKGYKQAVELRIDPMENNCIIKNFRAYTVKSREIIEFKIKYSNVDHIYENQYIFSDKDPQIYIDINCEKIEYLFIEFDIVEYDSKYINYISEILTKRKNILQEKDKYIEEKDKYIKEKDKYIEEKDKYIEEKDKYIEEIENILEKQRRIIEDMNNNFLWKIIQKYKRRNI